MKKLILMLTLILTIFFSKNVLAIDLIKINEGKITNVMVWDNLANGDARPVFFYVRNNNSATASEEDAMWCYIPADQSSNYSLILTLYSSQKTATIHCYEDNKVTVSGATANRLHRINSK